MQTTSKTDVFAFGVVLAELITGQRALARDKQDPDRLKTLVSVVSQRIRASSNLGRVAQLAKRRSDFAQIYNRFKFGSCRRLA